ncbi:MAG: flagellar hook-basal body complex protein FliE [Pirellulaceae bacterium]|nr:flagellar hook-basal body complex protein FliE [Pirellulaceae bacterium]
MQLHMPITQQLRAYQAKTHGQPEMPTSGSFMSLLSSGVQAVNQAQQHSDQQVHALLTGGDVQQAEVLTAVQKADMAFRLLIQIRNKLLTAYEELNAIRV